MIGLGMVAVAVLAMLSAGLDTSRIHRQRAR